MKEEDEFDISGFDLEMTDEYGGELTAPEMDALELKIKTEYIRCAARI